MTRTRNENKIDKNHIERKMRQLGIPGVSIAAFNSHGPTYAEPIGIDHKLKTQLNKNSIFRAASLSKPVFAYLVLKLIADNKVNKAKEGVGKFTLPVNVKEFDLDTPLYLVYPEILAKFSENDRKKAELLTARNILSHQSGLPGNQRDDPLSFLFTPGEQYGYSNPGIMLLQEVIDKITGSNLQTLAKANIFDNPEFHMENSSFVPPRHLMSTFAAQNQMTATNSLHTTASDYARFIAGWMRDEELWKQAVTSQISIVHDDWAARQGLSEHERKQLAWGIGMGLEVDSHDHTQKVFHSGDMNEWRAFVAIDATNKTGIVYFANGKNGLMLADDIIAPNIELKHGLNYIFEKYGFARNAEPGWEENEKRRVIDIIETFELRVKDKSDREMARSSFGQSSDTAHKSPSPFSTKPNPSKK